MEQELIAKAREQFPDWYNGDILFDSHSAYINREEEEWQSADLILCGSEFVKQGIKACGGPDDRCVVVPYGVDIKNFYNIHNQLHSDFLNVLTVGTIGLRKGSPYILAVAKLLIGKAQFRMVGLIDASTQILKDLPENVEIMGPVPRSEIHKQFAWADVFLLPSLCEGSATVTYEAFAAGLPVICTANTGSLVTDGVDGFLVELGDYEGIASKLEYLSNAETLHEFSSYAREKARLCSLDAYSDRLINTLEAC
ncbi:MAG: hypothetical protein CTY16_03080 [Methylobacter sp.]|nr:MAG: hypothetical protein CTY16_03080 [Methylobacter sp.]